MTEELDKCSFCDKHLTVKRLKNEKAEMYNSRERLYQEYLGLQSQLAEKDKQIADLEKQNEELQQKYLSESYEKSKLVSKVANAKELLRRVVEWADWQSGSKCPSFQDIETDIKEFLE